MRNATDFVSTNIPWLYVYAGADGAFTLYDDDAHAAVERSRPPYERGELSRIPLIWNDATRTLTIGARQGSLPGLLAERTFQAVLVSPERPVGFSFTPTEDCNIICASQAIDTSF